MRIGEILLRHGWVEWEPLALAIDDHRRAGARLVSYLVSKGEVDFDEGSRALAEQHGVAAALRRHIERRDREAARVLPAALGRRLGAVPLGRLGTGTLIVCVSDPSDDVLAELSHVAGDVALAVAPATWVERMVASAYPKGASGELEIPVDLDDPEEPDDLGFDLLDEEDGADQGDDFAIDIEMPAEAPRKPVSTSRALPVVIKAKPAPATARDSLDATLSACRDIDELPWLLDVVMEYVGKRWASSLLVEVRERRAIGARGHGAKIKPGAVKGFVFALDEPSIVKVVVDGRSIVQGFEEGFEEPRSEDDTALANALGTDSATAAPLTRGDAIAYVLVVGDPIDKDPEETEIDLGLLIEGVSDALARIASQ